MPVAAWQTAGVGLLMAVWWVTEALPIPATSLLPLAVFPLLDVVSFEAAARPYAHPLIFLFMGGFLLAVAMGRWGLPRRLSLRIVGAMGTRPRRLVAGFMVSTALFSMWVSNTATALMMLPIGLSLVELVQEEGEGSGEFAVPLMLGIAYGASIGGVGTLIGTPPNAFLAAFMAESHGIEIGFARWMLLGIPLVALALPLTYWLLTRVLHPVRTGRIPGGGELVRRELEAMGPAGPAERRVAAVFVLTAALWIFRPLLDDVVPGLTDAGVAMLSGLLLFLVPAGEPPPGDGAGPSPALLDWDSARELPWGVLILFGGGLSLAAAISSSGLTDWIGGAVEGLAGWPLLGLVAAVTAVVVLLTELTSNTATTAAFLPVVASVAVGLGYDPLVLAAPAALAASCAFMLPVATPPNAIVYGSGRLTVAQMARAGVWLNLLLTAMITGFAVLLVPLIFGGG